MQNHKNIFDVPKFRSLLQANLLGKTIWYYKAIPSTNAHLKAAYLPSLSNGLICLTDHQYSGNGQYNRNWESAENQNLTFTITLRKTPHQKFHLLNVAAAGALCYFLNETYGLKACIKWPNDVLVNHKKIAGFLTEAAFLGKVTEKVLIGIGINVNQQGFGDGIADFASSVSREAGRQIDREKFLAGYLSLMEKVIEQWKIDKLDTVHLINQRMVHYGNWVRLKGFEHESDAKYKLLGVDEEGFLRVVDEAMNVRIFKEEQVRIDEYY